ncbi:hypothetical protein H5410_001282 [Solanum commersonii]|uniref:Uncharacterized protein n=1 Tax=Solanum commersonii TaxID=4109 RepID=A0A9J6AY93_SOLCO|nr:hypothetical protein H5410_001282 [Solanum commersonii]
MCRMLLHFSDMLVQFQKSCHMLEYITYVLGQQNEASSMTTSQSFVGVTSSSNIKCSSCLCEKCEQQHDYLISRVKELINIFKEMTYNNDVHTCKKISQPLKCRRLKKLIFQSLSIKAKEKEKKKEKKVVSCDVKQQYPFEGFNIDDEGLTELMASFSQWINEGLYKHHAKKRDKDDH